MSKPLTLEEIVPAPAEFSISNGKTFKLDKMNIVHSQWLNSTFGEGGMQKIFKNLETQGILRMGWRMLNIDDKKKFPPTEVEEVCEDTGVVQTKTIGGLELFKAEFNGPLDLLELLKALLKTIGISQPVLDKLTDESAKKKLMEQIGHPSSTPLEANTDGPQNTSAP